MSNELPNINPYQSPSPINPIPTAPAGLGSLAQSERLKKLHEARNVLFFIGGLTVIANIVLYFVQQGQIDQEAANLQAQQPGIDPQLARNIMHGVLLVIQAIGVSIGLLFIGFGFLVKRYPVPIMVSALAVYILATLGFALLDPASLLQGIIVKVIIVIGLYRGLTAASAYQKEMQAAGAV